jgi:hypothetical protein
LLLVDDEENISVQVCNHIDAALLNLPLVTLRINCLGWLPPVGSLENMVSAITTPVSTLDSLRRTRTIAIIPVKYVRRFIAISYENKTGIGCLFYRF